MRRELDDTGRLPPDPTSAAPPPAYEPPAIAWEEPFATTIAASCALADPLNGCDVRVET